MKDIRELVVELQDTVKRLEKENKKLSKQNDKLEWENDFYFDYVLNLQDTSDMVYEKYTNVKNQIEELENKLQEIKETMSKTVMTDWFPLDKQLTCEEHKD